jgi:selenocysteine-specific elongation factor
VLDHLDKLPYRREADHFEYLKTRLSGDTADLLLTELTKTVMSDSKTLLEYSTLSSKQIETIVKMLSKDNLIGSFENKLFHVEHLNSVVATFEENSTAFLKSKPHLKGLTREQIGEFSETDTQQATDLHAWLIHIGKLVKLGDRYNLVGRGMSLKGNIKIAHDQIIAQLKDSPHTPPKLEVLAKEGKDYREAIKFIIESGEGYKCGAEFVFLINTWEEMITFLKTRLSATGQLTVSDLKEEFGMSRKFAIPILEETDRLKLTARDGDIRIKGDRFDN